MTERSKSWLTETDELAAELDAPDIVIIDASWHMPGDGKDARAEYLEEHIPGAIFFDIDEIADTKSNLPHMLPPPEKFSSRMRSMGIGDGSRIVVYDAAGIYSAARVWWTFRVMGVEDVTVLNGGLPKWKREGLPLESGEPRLRSARHFTSRRNADLVRDVFDMKATDQGPFGRDRRRPIGREIFRARARAACRASLGPHSRRPQPSLRTAPQAGRHAQEPRPDRGSVQRGRRRSLQARGDKLRLGHHGKRARSGAGRDRPSPHGGL